MIRNPQPGTLFVYEGVVARLAGQFGEVTRAGSEDMPMYVSVRMQSGEEIGLVAEQNLHHPLEKCYMGPTAVHRWIRVSSGATVRPDTRYGCQHCPAETTGAEQAARRNEVLLAKPTYGPRHMVHRTSRYSLREDGVALVGSRREAVALVNALAEGPVLRRGKVVEAGPAAVWTLDGDRCVYAPGEPGNRTEELAPLV